MSSRNLDLKNYIARGWFNNDPDDDLSNFIELHNSTFNDWLDSCDVLALRLR